MVWYFLQEFDVFVSYAGKDSEWVCEELRRRLEDEEPSFRLCLHQRDFVGGIDIADNIVAAVNTSRRTVIFLTEEYLKRPWCQFEFALAHHKVYRNGILILCSFENVNSKALICLSDSINMSTNNNNICLWGIARCTYTLTGMYMIHPCYYALCLGVCCGLRVLSILRYLHMHFLKIISLVTQATTWIYWLRESINN